MMLDFYFVANFYPLSERQLRESARCLFRISIIYLLKKKKHHERYIFKHKCAICFPIVYEALLCSPAGHMGVGPGGPGGRGRGLKRPPTSCCCGAFVGFVLPYCTYLYICMIAVVFRCLFCHFWGDKDAPQRSFGAF